MKLIKYKIGTFLVFTLLVFLCIPTSLYALQGNVVLWNKVGSDHEALYSEIGYDFETREGEVQYESGRFDNTIATTGGTPHAGPAAVAIRPNIDGTIRDGPLCPTPGSKDGAPDCIFGGVIIQTLDVPQFEDRAIIEYDISSVSQPVTGAELELNVFGANGPFPFTIDVFTYAGDGELSLDDFNAGSLFTSFEYSGQSNITLDVTSFISNLVGSEDHFAGFNFQFAVPSSITLNGPFVSFNTLEVPPATTLNVEESPLPCTLSADLSYSDDTLNMEFEVGTTKSARWRVFLVRWGVKKILISDRMIIDPPITLTLSIPGFENQGAIGILTTLTTGKDLIICSDFETVDTGQPDKMTTLGYPTPTIEDLRWLFEEKLNETVFQHPENVRYGTE